MAKHPSGVIYRGLVVPALLVASLASCEGDQYAAVRPSRTVEVGTPHNAGSTDSFTVLIGAGDIGDCTRSGAEITAGLIDSLLWATTAEAWVFTLGDNAYKHGTATEFMQCYDPHWGRFRDVTRPVTGNHEWENGRLFGVLPLFENAHPYFAYFSSFPGQIGTQTEPWYRYRHGVWDVLALDAGVSRRVAQGDPLWNWLETELRTLDQSQCVLAYSHFPRFSVGTHGDNPRMRDMWDLMDRHGVDIFVAGHDHKYERFEPQTADGTPDSTGIRQFVVGTGGGELRMRTTRSIGDLALWMADNYGVIVFRLYEQSYTWEFVTPDGVRDAGSSPCQNV